MPAVVAGWTRLLPLGRGAGDIDAKIALTDLHDEQLPGADGIAAAHDVAVVVSDKGKTSIEHAAVAHGIQELAQRCQAGRVDVQYPTISGPKPVVERRKLGPGMPNLRAKGIGRKSRGRIGEPQALLLAQMTERGAKIGRRKIEPLPGDIEKIVRPR